MPTEAPPMPEWHWRDGRSGKWTYYYEDESRYRVFRVPVPPKVPVSESEQAELRKTILWDIRYLRDFMDLLQYYTLSIQSIIMEAERIGTDVYNLDSQPNFENENVEVTCQFLELLEDVAKLPISPEISKPSLAITDFCAYLDPYKSREKKEIIIANIVSARKMCFGNFKWEDLRSFPIDNFIIKKRYHNVSKRASFLPSTYGTEHRFSFLPPPKGRSVF